MPAERAPKQNQPAIDPKDLGALVEFNEESTPVQPPTNTNTKAGEVLDEFDVEAAPERKKGASGGDGGGELPPEDKRKKVVIEGKKSIEIESAEYTEKGERHKENEDTVLNDKVNRVFGIFDGMGGHEGGKIASTTARDYVVAHLSEIPDGLSVEEAKAALVKIIIGADRAIQEKSVDQPKDEKMGTTATVLKIHTDNNGKNWAIFTNVGDSRLYKLEKNGEATQLTEDDDLVSSSTSMTPEQKREVANILATARTRKDLGNYGFLFDNRNVIVKSVGGGISDVKVGAYPLEGGEDFLLTCDGIHDNLTTKEIEEVGYDLKKLVDNASARAKESKEREMRAKKPDDDKSAVLVKTKKTVVIKEKGSGSLRKGGAAIARGTKTLGRAIGQAVQEETKATLDSAKREFHKLDKLNKEDTKEFLGKKLEKSKKVLKGIKDKGGKVWEAKNKLEEELGGRRAPSDVDVGEGFNETWTDEDERELAEIKKLLGIKG